VSSVSRDFSSLVQFFHQKIPSSPPERCPKVFPIWHRIRQVNGTWRSSLRGMTPFRESRAKVCLHLACWQINTFSCKFACKELCKNTRHICRRRWKTILTLWCGIPSYGWLRPWILFWSMAPRFPHGRPLPYWYIDFLLWARAAWITKRQSKLSLWSKSTT
jgi:hypothetical protein